MTGPSVYTKYPRTVIDTKSHGTTNTGKQSTWSDERWQTTFDVRRLNLCTPYVIAAWGPAVFCDVCLVVGCLSSQQHASVSQGRICEDNFTCCHTEIFLWPPSIKFGHGSTSWLSCLFDCCSVACGCRDRCGRNNLRDRSCRPTFPSHPVTVYWHRANKSQCWPENTRRLAG